MLGMKTSLKGLMEIAAHEGVCRTKYKDSVGVWTIGVGATKSEIPDLSTWSMEKTLSIPAVFKLFQSSIRKYEDAVNKVLDVPLNQYQFDALVSICYNIGTGGLTKSTFMKRINNKAKLGTIVDAILMWNKPKEILGRRKKEAKLYATGVYSGEGKCLVFPVNPKTAHPQYSKGYEINVADYLTELE